MLGSDPMRSLWRLPGPTAWLRCCYSCSLHDAFHHHPPAATVVMYIWTLHACAAASPCFRRADVYRACRATSGEEAVSAIHGGRHAASIATAAGRPRHQSARHPGGQAMLAESVCGCGHTEGVEGTGRLLEAPGSGVPSGPTTGSGGIS